MTEHQTQPSFSMDHLMVREGGQTAQAEPTVQCPEAGSDTMELPGGSSSVRREAPILSETHNPLNIPQVPSTTVPQQGNGGQPSRHQARNLTPEEIKMIRLKSERETLWKSLGKTQGVKIASFNMKGRRDERRKSKWATITTLMRKQRLLVMAVQETHLNEEEATTLTTKFPKIIVESNGNSTNSGGVAFVLNKDLLNELTWTHTELIPGRMSRLQILTKDENGLDIINIYAPNNNAEKAQFYETVYTILTELEDLEEPILMGDFNFVESAIDRAPQHEDDKNVTENFTKIRKKLELYDGWREHSPLEKQYTFFQETPGSASRIDRIYIHEKLFTYAYNFGVLSSLALSDHDIVFAEILKKKLPFIGKGMGRINIATIERESFRKRAKTTLMTYQEELERKHKNNTPGIQKDWMELKERLKEIAISDSKERSQNLKREKETAQHFLERKMDQLATATVENRKRLNEEMNVMRKNLAKTSMKEVTRLQEVARMRYRKLGERCTKYFFGLNKKKFEQQIILGLLDKDQKMTTATREMTKIATEYHEKLQTAPEMTEERKEAIQEMLDITDKTLTESQKEMLEASTTQGEIEDVISIVSNGTTPGIDGIPYEFYKSWKSPETEEEEKTEPDIAKMLHIVYNDIEKRGLQSQQTGGKRRREFTDGVMYLLYKKKDKRMIENYRPITLLNTDYKIYTKTIAIKLGLVAPTLISEDQAGFVPGRNLYDHTKTTHVVAEYCELVGYNGCIVALDQEKAYDKIDHEYMWQILKKNGFPETFINRIKEMYKDAGKSVMVNGVLPRQFKVKRGVHQGDPMSCLLYNFAIEPLAESLRKSTLKGIEIKGMTRKLLVTLFADDTLVYLREDDDFKELERILTRFCLASTAKFNLGKTEYLPIGDKNYRAQVIANHKVGENTIEEGITIIKDGEPMRTLGAWVGNNADVTQQWDWIIKKQEKVIKTWEGNNLSYQGKELILKALIQSRAVFLTTVNGMPKNVEEKLTKMYKDFLWDGKKRGLMAWKQAAAPRENGGLNVPDVKSRVQAIQLMWFKRWLNTTSERPLWAHIIDAIIAKNAPKTPITDENSRLNWMLQGWQESEGKDTKISNEIKQMLKTARRYNATVTAPRYSMETKKAWPLWWHIDTNHNYLWNKKTAKHIRNDHKISTVGDLMLLREELETEPCTNACNQMATKLLEPLSNKTNPLIETPKKVREQALELTPTRMNESMASKDKAIFDPNIVAKGTPLKETRIFMTNAGPKTRQKTRDTITTNQKEPAYRKEPNENPTEQNVTIATKTTKTLTAEEKVACAIWFGEDDERNTAIRMKAGQYASMSALVTAAAIAADKDRDSKLTILTPSTAMIKMIKGEHIKREDEDWYKFPLREEWRVLLNILRQRTQRTTFILSKPKSRDTEKAKRLATEALTQNEITEPNLRTREEFDVQGVRLRVLTQKLAYAFTSKANTEEAGGIKTLQNMMRAKNDIEEMTGTRPHDSQLWKGIKKIEQLRVSDFLWKMMHGRIKCGSWFRNIPQWEEKQYCPCGQVEEMEHILLTCKENKTEDLWKMIADIWNKMTETPFVKPTMGVILGIGSVTIRKKKTEDPALSYIYRVFVLTAAWVIWRNRNERVFNEVKPSQALQVTKWLGDLKETIRIEYDAVKMTPFREREPKYKAFEKRWAVKGVLCELTEGKNERNLKMKVWEHTNIAEGD